MNCRQCGATMRLDGEKNIFYCEYCGSYDIPEPDKDGVSLLNNKTSFLCPVCNETLVEATINNEVIYSCPKCRGNLIYQSKMLLILGRTRPSRNENLDPVIPLDSSELQRKILCPVCQKMMSSYQYGGGCGNIIIQGCDACELIWLDIGDLSKIMFSYSQKEDFYGKEDNEDRQFYEDVSPLNRK